MRPLALPSERDLSGQAAGRSMSQARTAMTTRSVDDLARTLAPQRPSSAPTSSMDSLARSLAMPMPRRRALRLLGSALVLAAVPALRPSRARATGGGVEAGPNIEAGPDIIDPPEGPFGPPVRCGDTVCNPASNCVKCCPAQGGGGSCCPCYFSCTTTGSGLCNKPVACPPDGRPFCGPPGHCCASNESCYRGSICLPICKPGEQLCEDDCCPRGTECANLPLPGGRARRAARRSVQAAGPAAVSRAAQEGLEVRQPGSQPVLPVRHRSEAVRQEVLREREHLLRPAEGALLQEERDLRGLRRRCKVLPEGHARLRDHVGQRQSDLLQEGRDVRAGRRRVRHCAVREPAQVHVLPPKPRGVLRRRRRRRLLPGRIPLARRQVHPSGGRRRRTVLS